MTVTTNNLIDLEPKVAAGKPLTHAEALRVLACTDLVSVGILAEQARRRATGDRVTFLRVVEVPAGVAPADRGDAGEVRVTGVPASLDEARRWVSDAVRFAAGVPVSAFSSADLLEVSGSVASLDEWARELRAAGLDAIAETPIDRFDSADRIAAVLRAFDSAGIGAWRLTVDGTVAADRLDLIERAARVQEMGGHVRAFAPLPRVQPVEQPSTGYDDVRTVAVARLINTDIELIQVDWPLYGPKLAQVAVAFGANDIDGVATMSVAALGPRKTPIEEIARQIRAASGVPRERDGRFVISGE